MTSRRTKDSGIPWIGQVPVEWTLRRYKHVFKERDERSLDGSEILLSVSAYTGVSPRSQSIEDGELEHRAATLEGYKICYAGDLVMNIMLAWNRAQGISAFDGIVSPAYSVFSVIDDSDRRFLNYLVRCDTTTAYFRAYSYGIIESRLRLYPETFGSLRCALPRRSEQSAIANYLDRKTTRIDALVTKKTRFIELLREKRQALITQAVTKGLDPSVPMKDSGVEWLGEVPADWKVLSLKRIGRLKGGSGFPPSLQGRAENEIPFFKVGDLGKSPDGKYLGDTEHTITHGEAKELGATVFPANVLVWAKIGAALSLNRRRITTKPSCLDNNMTGFVPDTTLVSTRYSFYLMSSVDFTVHAKPGAVPSFSEGDQGELQISLPPRRFQDAIVAHLDRATSRIDRLIDKTERSIELLREHRTALITAAVTGKVDLREAA